MKFNISSLFSSGKKSIKQKTANLLYYNCDSKISFTSQGGKISQFTKAITPSARIATLLNFDLLLKTNIEVPKDTDENDIDDFIIENTYKQLNIPTDASYEISYFKIETSFDADHWNYDVYAIDAGQLEKTYDDLVAKSQFIDVITASPFLPLVLYKKGKLDVADNHIFVFVGANSGIFAFYSKGEPIYVKTIGCNMHRLRVEFNQETSLELSTTEFENFISGNSQESAEHKASIDSMLDKISRDIEENILYIKRVYQDLDPHTMYFGMSSEYDNAYLQFFKDSFLIDVQPFNQLAFTDVQRGEHAIASIAMHYADLYINDPQSKLPNFSYAKRPKPLSQRECGQFVMIVAGIFVLSLAYPVYNLGMGAFLSFRGDTLQSEYDSVLHPQAEEYRGREGQLKTQIDSLRQTKTGIDKEIADVRGNMSDIHTWQVGYIQKSKVVDDILKVAKNSKVDIVKYTAIANNNQQLIVELNLFAKTQKDISDFILNLNNQKIYKSVKTTKVQRFAESRDTAPNKAEQTPAQKIANVAKNVANTAESALDSATETLEVESISAKYDFSINPDLEKRVSQRLNSIVKVVVR
ncbi:hypothetical protein [Helicobacter sp. 23-1045]